MGTAWRMVGSMWAMYFGLVIAVEIFAREKCQYLQDLYLTRNTPCDIGMVLNMFSYRMFVSIMICVGAVIIIAVGHQQQKAAGRSPWWSTFISSSILAAMIIGLAVSGEDDLGMGLFPVTLVTLVMTIPALIRGVQWITEGTEPPWRKASTSQLGTTKWDTHA